tara:strand:- start:23057 stop:23428 length:372 start_codon:yes stop_codon:yes gene_type:complete
MQDKTSSWQAVAIYVISLICMFTYGSATAQNPCSSEICVVQFNASWNGSNGVDYLNKLTECSVMNVSIDEGTWQEDFGIVVVPTIVVFNGKEVKRFQANIMMQMEATRKDVQGIIDEIIYSDF